MTLPQVLPGPLPGKQADQGDNSFVHEMASEYTSGLTGEILDPRPPVKRGALGRSMGGAVEVRSVGGQDLCSLSDIAQVVPVNMLAHVKAGNCL
ncbi:hypothetical protein HBJ58_10960 [Halomonas desiderata]|nr:hypothetical protein [Halomonas desiderata]